MVDAVAYFRCSTKSTDGLRGSGVIGDTWLLTSSNEERLYRVTSSWRNVSPATSSAEVLPTKWQPEVTIGDEDGERARRKADSLPAKFDEDDISFVTHVIQFVADVDSIPETELDDVISKSSSPKLGAWNSWSNNDKMQTSVVLVCIQTVKCWAHWIQNTHRTHVKSLKPLVKPTGCIYNQTQFPISFSFTVPIHARNTHKNTVKNSMINNKMSMPICGAIKSVLHYTTRYKTSWTNRLYLRRQPIASCKRIFYLLPNRLEVGLIEANMFDSNNTT